MGNAYAKGERKKRERNGKPQRKRKAMTEERGRKEYRKGEELVEEIQWVKQM